MPKHGEQALNETDLAAVFRDIEDGNYLEPSDDEFERGVHGWAPSYATE